MNEEHRHNRRRGHERGRKIQKVSPSPALTCPRPEAIARMAQIFNNFALPVYRHLEQAYGLARVEWIVLMWTVNNPGIGANEIAAQSGQPKNSISRAVQALQSRGLIARQPDPEDGRRRPLVATDEGRALYERIIPCFLEREQRLFAAFSNEEKQSLERLLNRLAAQAHSLGGEY